MTIFVLNARHISYETIFSEKTKEVYEGNDNNDEKNTTTTKSSSCFNHFQFRCNQQNQQQYSYGFEIQLEHAVEKENIAQKVSGNSIRFTFQKLLDEYAPSWTWLTKNGSKYTKHFISIDWDQWKEEDDDGENDNCTHDRNHNNDCDSDHDENSSFS